MWAQYCTNNKDKMEKKNFELTYSLVLTKKGTNIINQSKKRREAFVNNVNIFICFESYYVDKEVLYSHFVYRFYGLLLVPPLLFTCHSRTSARTIPPWILIYLGERAREIETSCADRDSAHTVSELSPAQYATLSAVRGRLHWRAPEGRVTRVFPRPPALGQWTKFWNEKPEN